MHSVWNDLTGSPTVFYSASMIQAGAGQSQSSSTAQAAEEAAQSAMSQAGISQADMAVVFFTAEHAKQPDDLTKTISRVIGTDCLVGSSAVGVLTGAGEIEGSGGIAVLVIKADEIVGRPFIFEPLKDNEVNLGTTFGDFVAKTQDERSLMLLLPDTYNGNPQPLLDSMAARAGFHPVVGAGSSEGSGAGSTHQLCGDKIASNSIAGAYLSGAFDLFIDITQGCQPITPPLTITKSERNLIHEIDGKPALEVFAGLLKGPLAEDLRRALMVLFVGLPADRADNSVADGRYLVRNIIGLDPKKGVVGVAQEVHDGEAMIFAMRDGQRAREDLNQMLGRQATRLGDKKPAFGLYFNCCARGTSLYGIPDIDSAYIRQAFGDVPLIGMFGGYELAPLGKANHLFAYTGVLALVTDRD